MNVELIINNAAHYPDKSVIKYAPTVLEVLMRKHGITQKMLAEMLGATQARVSNYTTRTHFPGTKAVEIMCNAIGLARPELLLTVWNPAIDYEAHNHATSNTSTNAN